MLTVPGDVVNLRDYLRGQLSLSDNHEQVTERALEDKMAIASHHFSERQRILIHEIR